jgi:hypothetical protein
MAIRLLVGLVVGAVCWGQTGTPARTTWTTAPTAVTAFESTSFELPASATQICSPGTVAVVRTSDTVLTLASGAADATPQYVHFNPRSRSLTAAVTLTISSGSATGVVDVYGFILPSGAFEFRAINASTNTLSLSAGSVLASGSAQVAETRTLGIKLYTWVISSGVWAASGLNAQSANDCWVDYLEISNSTGSAVSVTVTDGQGTPVAMFTGASLPANTTWVVMVAGGRYFEKGMKVTAGTAEAVTVYARGGRR